MADLSRPQSIPAAPLSAQRSALSARAWAGRGVWLGVGAAGLAAWALTWLGDPAQRTAALGALVVAGGLAMIAWGSVRPIPGVTAAWAVPAAWDRARLGRLGGVALAGVLSLWASAAYLTWPQEPFGLAGLLWLASMAVLLAAAATGPRPAVPAAPTVPTEPSPGGRGQGAGESPGVRPALTPARADTRVRPYPAGAGSAAPPVGPVSSLPVRRKGTPAALSAVPLPVRRVRPARPPGSAPAVAARPAPPPAPTLALAAPPAWTRWEVGVVVGLVALGLLTHLWDLQNIPWAIHPDESDMGAVAMASYLQGHAAPVFSTVWENADLPALWFAGMAAAFKLGGVSLASLRWVSALCGGLAVAPFYGFVRGVWGRAAAIGGTALLACSAADIHYSRVTLNNIAPSFFWAACFFFLLRGLRGGRPLDWVLAGLLGGLGEYTYYGNRLLPFVLIGLAGYLVLVYGRRGLRLLGGFALLGFSYLVAFGPLLGHFLVFRPDLYFGRGKSMLTWDHIPTSWDDFQLMLRTLWSYFATNLLAISTIPSVDGVYWSPLLLVGEAALLVLGTALLIRQWRHPASFLLLAAGMGVLFVGGTLTRGTGIGPPFLAHWTPAFPVFYAVMAAPLGAWAASWHWAPPRWRVLGPALLGLLVIVLGWQSLSFYNQQYVVARPSFVTRSTLGRWQAGLGPGYRVYTVGKTWQPYDPALHQYLLADQEGASLLNPARDLPLPPAPGQGLAFAFSYDNAQYQPVVESFYPGGTWAAIHADDGKLQFTTYVVPPERVAAQSGVLLTVFAADGAPPRWAGQVAQVGDLPNAAGPYPARARWSGWLYVPLTTTYGLGSASSQIHLWLDSQQTAPSSALPLGAGWHSFIVEAAPAEPGAAHLTVTPEGQPPAEVPAARLWSAPIAQGLQVRVRQSSGADQVRVDPLVAFAGITPPHSGPPPGPETALRARWLGDLLVTQPGVYILELRADGLAGLALDQPPGALGCAPGGTAFQVDLTAGPHPMQIDLSALPGQRLLELYWTPPGGPRAIVPPSALRYGAPAAALPFPGVNRYTAPPCGGQ